MSKIRLLLSYGLRDASKSRVILVLIITSLSIAFTAVLASSSILDGFKKILIGGALGTTGDLIAVATTTGATIPNVNDVVKKIEKIEGVSATTVHSQATLILDNKAQDNGQVTATEFSYGVIPVRENEVTSFSDKMMSGEFLNPSGDKEIVLGQAIADHLVGQKFDKKIPNIGDKIEITTFTGKKETYTIVGISDVKSFLGNLFVLLNKSDLEDLDDTKVNTEINIKLKDTADLESVKKQIEDLNLSIRVETWKDRSGYIDDILGVVTFLTLLINRLLIVSVFVIISIIVFISVFQKRRQIGVMKSMGANNSFIVGIFMFETLLYSILSYAIGFCIFMLIYSYSSAHPFPTTIGDFALVFNKDSVINTSIILLIATIAGSFIPSYVAAKTRIVEVLQANV